MWFNNYFIEASANIYIYIFAHHLNQQQFL